MKRILRFSKAQKPSEHGSANLSLAWVDLSGAGGTSGWPYRRRVYISRVAVGTCLTVSRQLVREGRPILGQVGNPSRSLTTPVKGCYIWLMPTKS